MVGKRRRRKNTEQLNARRIARPMPARCPLVGMQSVRKQGRTHARKEKDKRRNYGSVRPEVNAEDNSPDRGRLTMESGKLRGRKRPPSLGQLSTGRRHLLLSASAASFSRFVFNCDAMYNSIGKYYDADFPSLAYRFDPLRRLLDASLQ